MFIYDNKEYKSKAAAVRDLYDAGLLLNTPESKKEWAEKLDMAVQSVHGRIKNHIAKNGEKTPVEKAVEKNIVEKVVAKRYKGKKPLFPNDTEEKKEKYKADPNKIFVTWSPNPWGIPVTTPPTPVIDPRFKNAEEAWEYDNGKIEDEPVTNF